MSLITRQGKGSKLTIEELDGNLTYLEGLVSLYKKTVSSNIDWSEASMQEIEINENTNFTFTGATTGQTLSLILDAKKTALITWPESIQWTTDINQLDLNYTISYTDVGTGFNSDVYSIAIQADGKIIVGGYFSEYNGVAANGIIRLNSNGSIDTSFVIGTGFNSLVYSIAIQDDGKILVGGYFSEYNGVSANGIIRLNSDGSRDTLFDTKFDINLTNILYVIKTKLNNIYLGFLFENSDNYSIIMASLNYEQVYEICNFYYNGTYYIGESTI